MSAAEIDRQLAIAVRCWFAGHKATALAMIEVALAEVSK